MYNFSQRILDWVFRYAVYISSISLIFLSVIDISNWNEYKFTGYGLVAFPLGKIFYCIIVLLTILFAFIGIENNYKIRDLQNELQIKARGIIDVETALNDSIKEMNELFNSYLMLLVESLNFTSSERISVYKVYDDKFLLLGRVSKNPTLEKASRNNYPLNEGFICKGWEEGEFFIDNLPDPSSKLQYYTACNGICAIPKDIINGIKMQSRSFYIKRLAGFDAKPKAIIVIESKLKEAFKKEEIDDKLEIVIQPLIMFIENNNGITRTQTNTMEL